MYHVHLTPFSLLALAVALLGAWTALDLFNRARHHTGRGRRLWLGAAAVSLGLGVWSMHFIAMLGFRPQGGATYDGALTLLSFVLAVVGSGAGFLTVGGAGAARWRLAPAALLMGGAVASMHYVGIAAMRVEAPVAYRPVLMLLSVAIAVAAALAALVAARRERSLGWRAVATVLLALAIVAMHYTGMAALILTPEDGVNPAADAWRLILAVSVTAGAVVILFMALGASLLERRADILAAVDAGGIGFWEAAIPLRTTVMSERAREILSIPKEARLGPAEISQRLAPEDLPLHQEALARAVSGEADYDQEWRLPTTGRWIHLRGRLIRSRSGRPMRMSGVITDTTDRREAFAALGDSERQQRLLINELNHRVKNTLATVQSIARQTARRTPDVHTFTELFEARLLALSNTQNLLTAGNWERVDLAALLGQEMAPYAHEQVRIAGPAVDLDPQKALGLGMVFHELAVNAAKYGALSTPSGCVRIDWSVAGGDLLLDWIETGGPPVSPPTRRGFGGDLMEATLNRTLKGTVVTTYEPQGFSFSVRLPI